MFGTQPQDSHQHVMPVAPNWQWHCRHHNVSEHNAPQHVRDEFEAAMDQFMWELSCMEPETPHYSLAA